MELLRRLIRNYYEINGNFDGIEDKLSSLISSYGFIEEDYYMSIGFKPSNGRSAKENYEKLVEDLKSRDISDPRKNDLSKTKVPHSTYVKLLSNYLRYSRSNVTSDLDFREYIKELGSRSLKNLIRTVNSSVFQETVNAMMPSLKFVEGVEPIIQLGVFYVPDKLTKRDIDYIKENSIKDAILNTETIREDLVLKIKSIVDRQFTEIYYVRPDDYREVLEIALMYNMSIKELLGLCGFNLIDYVKQYIEHRYIFRAKGRNVEIMVNDNKVCKNLEIDNTKFTSLFLSGRIEHLTIKDNEIYTYKNGWIPLCTLI